MRSCCACWADGAPLFGVLVLVCGWVGTGTLGTDEVTPPSVEVTPPTALLTAPRAFCTVLGGLTPVDGSGELGVPDPVDVAGVLDFFELFLFAPLVLSASAGHLDAVVEGPVSPAGAPPGSGTHALGFDGSVSLTPGWLGPSHE